LYIAGLGHDVLQCRMRLVAMCGEAHRQPDGKTDEERTAARVHDAPEFDWPFSP
jgi:hypothetical protein